MGKHKQRPHNQSRTPADPPLETLFALLNRLNTPVLSHKFGLTGDATTALREYMQQDPLDLSKMTVGNAEHLAVPYVSMSNVRNTLIQLGSRAANLDSPPTGRANAAAVNLIVASETMFGALTLHLQNPSPACLSSISLSRGALEAAATSLWIATRSGSEVRDWERNELRKVKKADLMSYLDSFLLKARKFVPQATVAYSWMCGFTHLEFKAIEARHQLPTEALHEQSYAAIAYSALVTSLVAEVVQGFVGTAIWPLAWPAALDWGAGFVPST